MGPSITLSGTMWTKINLSWTAFFVFLGVINLYVVYNYDTETWVNFKLFGLLGLTLVFVVAQAFYMMRHVPDEEEQGGSP